MRIVLFRLWLAKFSLSFVVGQQDQQRGKQFDRLRFVVGHKTNNGELD